MSLLAIGWMVTQVVTAGSHKQDAPPLHAPAPVSKGTLQIYDIRDLLRSLRGDHPKSVLSVLKERTAPDTAPLPQSGASQPGSMAAADADCRTLLRSFVQCVGAKLDQELTCEVNEGGAMVVRAQEGTHALIADLLLSLRERSIAAVPVEIRIFELDADGREKLADFLEEAGGGDVSGTQVIGLDPVLVGRFLDQHQVTLMETPRVQVLPLEPFEISAGSEVSYIAGMEQVAIEGIGVIADPVVKTLHEGLTIEGRLLSAEVMPGQLPAPYSLKLTCTVSALKRPIATAESDLGTIQLPELKHTDIGTTIAGWTGSSVLVGGMPKPSFSSDTSDTRIYLLVTVGAPRKKVPR